MCDTVSSDIGEVGVVSVGAQVWYNCDAGVAGVACIGVDGVVVL